MTEVDIAIDQDGKGGTLGRVRSEFGFIRGNLLLILLGWLLTDFTREMAFTYYPLYVQALGGTASTVGLLGAASQITSALMQFPGGYIADKYGRKRIIYSMTMLAAFAYLFFMFAPNWQTILLGVILSEICFMYTPAFNALVMDSIPSKKRGTGYSIINLITSASTTPAPMLAGLLYLNFGLVTGTMISFGFVVVAFLISGLLRTRLKETLENPEPISGREVLHSFTGARTFIDGIKAWDEVPKAVLALLLIQLMFIIPNTMFNVTLIFYVTEVLGFTPMELAYVGTAISVSVIALAIPCGKLVDKIGKKKPILIASVLIAIAMPFMITGTFVKVMIIAPVIALVNILFGTAIQALNADLIPQEHRGKILGSRSFFLLIASSFGSIMGGYIYDNISKVLPMYILWAVNVPFFVLIYLFVKEPQKEDPVETLNV
jgi:DHA1 family multidrug resistance protein-like MFS transporter